MSAFRNIPVRHLGLLGFILCYFSISIAYAQEGKDLSCKRPATPGPQLEGGLAALHKRFAVLSKNTGGIVGAVAWHLESGRYVTQDSDTAFPMQSVYKFPIAIQLLRRIQAGEHKLTDSIDFRSTDVRADYSPLSRKHPRGNTKLTVEQVLEATVSSDGAASDIALRLGGGPQAVNDMLATLGISGIRVDRTELQLMTDFFGIKKLPSAKEWSYQSLESSVTTVPLPTREMALKNYLKDQRDTATPMAMAQLWCHFQARNVLNPEMTDLLAKLLESKSPNAERLSAYLPSETVVLQKTGTSGTTNSITGTVNASGIMILPGKRGHVVFVVFVKAATERPKTISEAIAWTANEVYDYFAKSTPQPIRK